MDNLGETPKSFYLLYIKTEKKQMENKIEIKPKVWSCGHTEDEHCFADTMFCVRDPNWYQTQLNARRKTNGKREQIEDRKP
jgi:hypothetical protein